MHREGKGVSAMHREGKGVHSSQGVSVLHFKTKRHSSDYFLKFKPEILQCGKDREISIQADLNKVTPLRIRTYPENGIQGSDSLDGKEILFVCTNL
jgi:hypothetical protein